MLVGILSDSHGHPEPVRQAISLFDQLGVSHIIHCGDVGGMDVFDEMIDRPFTFVWGNTDMPSNSIYAYLDVVNIKPPRDVPVQVTLDGKQFAVFHGHEVAFEYAQELAVDYVLHGHSHVKRDENVNGLRFINPGALHRAARKTVATMDTSTDELTFHEING